MTRSAGSLVRVLGLGGTIAMGERGTDGMSVTLDADDLVRSLNLEDQATRVDTRELRSLDSTQLDLDAIDDVVVAIADARRDGCTGVVVTQGTDTLEEVAFALDCLIDTTALSVVVTGALRNPTMPGADGPANLRAALRVAASPVARGLGVVAVLNDEVHAAAFVQKTHSANPAAFRSYPGILGWLLEDRVNIVTRPSVRAPVSSERAPVTSVVPLLTSYLGDPGRAIGDAVADGATGIVYETFASGRVTPAAARALIRTAERVPVVVASRAGTGELHRETYGGEGSEGHLLANGVITAGWLSGVKARMLLELVVRSGGSREDVATAFRHFRAERQDS